MLNNTLTLSPTRSGKSYSSHIELSANRSAWMDIAVFDTVPRVPSLVGAAVYKGEDIVANGLVPSPPIANIHLSFELFTSESPNTVLNFMNLCNETTTLRQAVTYERQVLPLSFKGTFFHKIIPKFIAQGGDLTKLVAGGANHFSSFGKQFPDENLKRALSEPGMLAMANNGPNTNGSQFFITLGGSDVEKALDGRHCCFGRVTSGLDEFLKHVGPFGNENGDAKRFAVVTGCGAE